MKPRHFALAAAFPLAFASCKNPADDTVSATVTDAVEKTESGLAGGVRYVFTDASEISFVGSKVTGSHDGGFRTFNGHFSIADGAPVGNDHRVVIDMNSTWSDNDRLTGHLKNEDFFDVENHPEATFDVTSVSQTSDTDFQVSGNFTLRGTTKNITFPTTVTQDGETIHINAEFDINRQDFGVSYEGAADDLIRDQVVIRLKLVAEPEPADAGV